MPGDSSLALQKAVYAALMSSSALMALIRGVFDWVPDATEFPYVSIGDDTGVDFSGCTFVGKELTLTIHTWSRGNGRTEAKSIQAEIRKALDRAALTLTGATLIVILSEFEQTMLDPDGVTYHGIQRFRALTQEA